jgi:hypothetical protein
MEGLRYLAAEIQERRHLLHDFLRDRKFIGDMVTRAAKNPEECRYIKNGEIEFIPSWTRLYVDPANQAIPFHVADHVFPDLTFKDLVPYLNDFYDDTKASMLVMPITPFKPPPAGYKVQLTLTYVLGGGGYGAYLWAALDSQYTKRRFDIHICHNFLPENYRQSLGYQSWKRIRRSVSSLRAPEDNSDIKGKELIPDRIQIDEKTESGMIWKQLLLIALAQGYFGGADERRYEKACREIARVFGLPFVQDQDLVQNNIHSVLLPDNLQITFEFLNHFQRKKRLYPHNAMSSGAYIKKFRRAFFKKMKQEVSGGMQASRGAVTGDGEELHSHL